MTGILHFVTISLDPKGCYIGTTRNGWVWYYHPGFGKWLLIAGDDEDGNDQGNG